MAESVFREESLKKVSSPEELNDYIKVSKPNVWLVIAAAIILLSSLIVWGVCGSLDTTVTSGGIANSGTITCYMSDVSAIAVGDSVKIGSTAGEITSISEIPVSHEEAVNLCNSDEYTVYRLNLSDWNYVVEISAPSYAEQGFVTASIITDTVRPISFIWD